MKQLILCSILLSFAALTNAQQIKSHASLTQIDYAEKSKTQKKIGRILLGVGAGLLVTSLLIPEGDVTHEGLFDEGLYLSDKHVNDGIRAVFLVGGICRCECPIFYRIEEEPQKSCIRGS